MDLRAALKTFYNSEASGFIIWGSSDDVKTVDKCKQLLHYVETIFGPAIAKYTKKIDDVSLSRENEWYNDSSISTTQKQESDSNDVKNEVEKKNKTTATDDDKHHIEVIEVETHIKPEVAKELNQTLWKNVNMTVLDAIVQTWLLNLDRKDLNKLVETDNMTIAEHINMSGTLSDVLNVTYTNVSIFVTENPINNKITKESTKISNLTESPISEDVLITLDKEIIRKNESNNNYVSKDLKKGLPKMNLSEILNASESDEEFPTKNNTTQILNLKDKKKGVPKSSPKHDSRRSKIVPPNTTTVFATKSEMVTTTDLSTKIHISKNKKKGWLKFEDIDSTDVSQVSVESFEEMPYDLKGYENQYAKEGLMSSQPESEIVHNFLYLSKEEFTDSRTIEMPDKIFKSKNIKKGLPKLKKVHHHETTTEKPEQDIAYEGEATEQYSTTFTTDNVTSTTEGYLTVTTEIFTNTTEQLSTGITTEEVIQNDDLESSTKLNNVAENLISTTDKYELLQAAKKGVERSIEDAEEKSAESLDSEKEQVVVYK